MKKIIAFCSALLLAAAFTGCGKSSSDNSSSAPTNNSSENSNSEKSDKEEKVVVDAFDKVAYGVLKEDDWGHPNVYPQNFIIEMNASESPFGSIMPFSYSIEKADIDEIVIKAKANVEEIQDFLDNYNYSVEETEKSFYIKTSDLKTALLSADQITNDTKTTLINGMIDKLGSTFKTPENEEFEKEKAESQNTEFNIEKMYAIVPKHDIIFDNIYGDEQRSNIFDDDGTPINIKEITFESSLSYNPKVFGIFKDNDDNFYCVKTEPEFDKGILIAENLNYEFGQHFVTYENGGGGYQEVCPNEKTAYDCGAIKERGEVNIYFGDNDEFEIVEIPLS